MKPWFLLTNILTKKNKDLLLTSTNATRTLKTLHNLKVAKYQASFTSCTLNFRSLSIEQSPNMNLGDVIVKLNEFAPISLAESWDNVGLLIEPYTPKQIKKIFLTNDLTEKVLEEAIAKSSDLIISYHPPIFSGLKRITQSSWKERIVSICLEKRIAVFAPHTSWDAVSGGVTDWLAKSLPSSDVKPIVPIDNTPECRIGAGRIGKTEKITLRDAIERVKSHTNIKSVNVSLGVKNTLNSKIDSFAVCAGSGSSVLKGVPADLYITGEMSHHDVLEAAHNNVNVILCNHSNSERGYLNEFKVILQKLLQNTNIEIVVSETDADPLESH